MRIVIFVIKLTDWVRQWPGCCQFIGVTEEESFFFWREFGDRFGGLVDSVISDGHGIGIMCAFDPIFICGEIGCYPF